MKILQLNAWTGRIKGALLEFFEKNDFDIVCLQEAVWSDNSLLENFAVTVDQIKKIGKFADDFRTANWEIRAFGAKIKQGLVILSKEKMVEKKSELIHGKYKTLTKLEDIRKQGYYLQIAKFDNGLTVANHHGYWLPTPLGNETTVKTMRKVAKYLHEIDGPIAMCGDLNITHKSPAMRELDFLRDLTYEYKIDNTLMGLKFNGKVACDHILVNNDIKVEDFGALEVLASDHKALLAKIKIY